MKKKSIIVGFAVAAGVAGVLVAADFWEQKPYTEWSEKEVARVLEDSPWADKRLFRKEGPIQPSRGSRSSQPNINNSSAPDASRPDLNAIRDYVVRFWSALPIRMAWGRRVLLQDSSQAEAVQQYVDSVPFQGLIVVGLDCAQRSEIRKLEQMTLESFGENTYLELKSQKKKIFPTEYVKPSEFSVGAVLVFPRTIDGQEIDFSAEKEIRFRCEIDKDIRLDQKFKIAKMMYKGKLEI